MADGCEFQYNEDEQYPVPEFFKKYQDNFPMYVVVAGGFCGNTNYDDYSNDQVWRIYKVK